MADTSLSENKIGLLIWKTSNYWQSKLRKILKSYNLSLNEFLILQSIYHLDSIKSNAKDLFLMGDLFDFWYEYKEVVPKGFIRFFGKIAEISDNGTNIHLVLGNHDM